MVGVGKAGHRGAFLQQFGGAQQICLLEFQLHVLC